MSEKEERNKTFFEEKMFSQISVSTPIDPILFEYLSAFDLKK